MNLTKKQVTIYFISIMFFLFSFICVLIMCCSKNKDNNYQKINNLNDNDNLDSEEENIEENIDSVSESSIRLLEV